MLKRGLRWLPPLLVAIGVTVGQVGQRFSVQQAGSRWSTFWFGVAIAGALLAALTSVIERLVRERHDLAAARKIRVALNDALDPLVEALAKMFTTDVKERAKAQGSFLRQALTSAAQVVEGDRVRASYFSVFRTKNDKRELRCVDSTGRHGAPVTIFREGTPAGDAVLTMMRKNAYVARTDVKKMKPPPPGWDAERERDYRSFATVPARVGRGGVPPVARAFGMLTVDAPKRGVVTADDVPFLRVISTLIAVGTLLDSMLAAQTTPRRSNEGGPAGEDDLVSASTTLGDTDTPEDESPAS